MDEEGNANDENSHWSPTEVEKLIEFWTENASELNLARNESVMHKMADHIGTGKNAKQVRSKLKSLRSRFMLERTRAKAGHQSKWRYYSRLSPFGDDIVRPVTVTKVSSSPPRPMPTTPQSIPRVVPTKRVETFESKQQDAFGAMVQLLGTQLETKKELPPVYPYDPDVPANVRVDSSWSSWNAGLPYAMTDAGLRTLIRSGFTHVTHLELLKRKTAKISMLNLNYHDKLALEHALEAEESRAPQLELVSNAESGMLELRGCTDASDAILITAEGLKMLEWNKSLSHSLTVGGIATLLKAGFMDVDDVTGLMIQEDVDSLDLLPRDRAVLRKILAESKSL